MSIRKRPYAVRSFEHLDAYLNRGKGSIPGEYRERIDDGRTDYVDNMRGTYSRDEDGSVVFTIVELQRGGSLRVQEDLFTCGAVGIVVMSRHEIPAIDFVQA